MFYFFYVYGSIECLLSLGGKFFIVLIQFCQILSRNMLSSYIILSLESCINWILCTLTSTAILSSIWSSCWLSKNSELSCKGKQLSLNWYHCFKLHVTHYLHITSTDTIHCNIWIKFFHLSSASCFFCPFKWRWFDYILEWQRQWKSRGWWWYQTQAVPELLRSRCPADKWYKNLSQDEKKAWVTVKAMFQKCWALYTKPHASWEFLCHFYQFLLFLGKAGIFLRNPPGMS